MEREMGSGSPVPRPRTYLKPIGLTDDGSGDTDDSFYAMTKKKKKSSLTRLKNKKKESLLSNGNTTTEASISPKEDVAEELHSRIDEMDISNLLPDDNGNSEPHWSEMQSNLDEPETDSSPPSSRKKKKHKGAISRLKEKHLNDSLSSLRSEEMPDLRKIDDVDASNAAIVQKAATLVDGSSLVFGSGAKGDTDSRLSSTARGADITATGSEARQSSALKSKAERSDKMNSFDVGSSAGFLPAEKMDKLMEHIDMNSTVESDDEDRKEVAEQYEQQLRTNPKMLQKGIPQPKPSTSTPQRVTTLRPESAMVKAGSMPDISDSVRSSKRNWHLLKSRLGLDGVDTVDNMTMRRSLSATSMNTMASSGLHTVRISTARHKNFLVGQQNSHSSVMGAAELDRTFPDRNVNVFVGTWNMADQKTLNAGLEDFVLPTSLEFVPDVLVVTSQENNLDRKEWEITLQETIGPSHVIYHSAQHGTLHIAVCMKRELIWFCSMAEDDSATVRAFSQFKTKGAVAISFTMFGTSFLFIGCHFTAHDNNEKARIQDYININKSIKLPRAVVDNPLQETLPEASKRFDCVFWAGDLNFRVIRERDMVLKIIEAAKVNEHAHFEQLLVNEELTQAMSREEVFQDFQEGQIRFPPSYKFDIGTDNYDTKKLRIPSYTDRILFRCKKKHTIVCLKYNSAAEVMCSDHKPVYGLYQVNLKPGRDTIPLSAGQFRRDVYMEAAKRRALHRAADKMVSPSTRSAICSIS